MIRKRISVAAIFFVGILCGWLFRTNSMDWTAYASPQRESPARPQNPIQNPAPPIQLPASNGAPANPFPQPQQLGAGPAAVPVSNGIVLPDGFVASSQEEAINVSVYEQSNRSVVNISTKSLSSESLLTIASVEGSGSGSLFDKQGHILTNYHVVEGARTIDVNLFNGESFRAELIGADPDNDIAVLKINAPESMLFPIPWGDSSSLRVGQHVFAIGNPFGLERTMSTGIISSLNRQIKSRSNRYIRSIIQIDAALNQGNSGGPLLNSRGELIGMNTAIATRSGDNAGIGFAIPVNTVRRVVPQLITSGRILRPTIGIMQVYETGKGLLVVSMTPKGPAERAGVRGALERQKLGRGPFPPLEQDVINLRNADLIIGVDDQRVKLSDDLLSYIETKKAGDQVVLTVVRGGRQTQIPVVLGESE